MNRRGFLRGLLGVAVAPVAARVAPVIEAVASTRPVAGRVTVVGRGSLLVLDNLGIYVNCRRAADAALPLYVDGTRQRAQLDRLLADLDRAPERNAAMTREMLPLTSADLDRAVRDYAAGLKA